MHKLTLEWCAIGGCKAQLKQLIWTSDSFSTYQSQGLHDADDVLREPDLDLFQPVACVPHNECEREVQNLI